MTPAPGRLPHGRTPTWVVAATSIGIVCGIELPAAENIAMPQWSPERLEEMKLFTPDLGGTLFPGTEYSPEIGPSDEESLAEASWQLPLLMRLESVKDLPADLVNEYFPQRLEDRVVDPQRLLTQSRLDGVLNFLDYHFRESASEIYLLVLGPSQRIPLEIDLRTIHREWFGDRLCALVLYNFGNPEMSRIVFGEFAKKRVPEHKRVNACLQAINEAMVASNAEEQIERFLMELSQQLYWIEGIFKGATNLEKASGKPKSNSLFQAEEQRMKAVMRQKVFITLGSAVALISGLAAMVIFLQRHAAARSFYFPERRTLPRLRAPHGGGNRLVVSFDEEPPNPIV